MIRRGDIVVTQDSHRSSSSSRLQPVRSCVSLIDVVSRAWFRDESLDRCGIYLTVLVLALCILALAKNNKIKSPDQRGLACGTVIFGEDAGPQ